MDFCMRPSRVLRKLRAGDVVYSTKMNLMDTRAAEIAAAFGFDCLWTCMEHVPNDLAVIERQVLAAKAYDTDVVCRVARGSYSDYVRPFEMDATGIMVPHVMSVEDAEQVVRTCRFHPTGLRPVDGGNADGLYCNVSFRDYLEQANRERFIILQIEDKEAVECLDGIAGVDGYDMLFFGPGDFSHSIGRPGEWEHPDLIEARRRVAAAARSAGKWAATVGAAEQRDDLVEMGYRFINVGADVIGLSRYYRELAGACGLMESAGRRGGQTTGHAG